MPRRPAEPPQSRIHCPADGRPPLAPSNRPCFGSEVAPFAKTGGLADVVAALARALHRLGHDVRVFLPLYGRLRDVPTEDFDSTVTAEFELGFPDRTYKATARTAPLPDSEREDGAKLDVELIDCPELYHRDGYYTSDADEPVRWAALFARGDRDVPAHEAGRRTSCTATTGTPALLPLYLKTVYAWDELFAGTRTVLSIHNLGYTGTFGSEELARVGLGDARGMFHQEHLSDGHFSFLETGLIHAAWLSTVSETYGREIQTPEHGMGLDELLRARDDHLVGIVNGVDAGEWNPATDALLPHRYTADDLAGKALCRDALLKRLEVAPAGDGVMTIGIISRMTGQKGFELMPDVLSVLLQREDLRLVVLGSGEERYERYFNWLRDNFPNKVGVHLGYSEELAHWIEAGSDLFLMPSRYEPCGLNQMYSLAYGTVPLVRHTGGLGGHGRALGPRGAFGHRLRLLRLHAGRAALHDRTRSGGLAGS